MPQPSETPAPSGKSLSSATYIVLALISSITGVGTAFITAKSTAKDQADASVKASTPEVIRSAASIAKREVLLEIDRLMVSSAGRISSSGKVEYWKGIHFSVSKEEHGVFRVSFGVPFKDYAPIVVATPINPAVVVTILEVDTTGFRIQGTTMDAPKSAHVSFSFIAVEPERKN